MCLLASSRRSNLRPVLKIFGVTTVQLDIELLLKLNPSRSLTHEYQAFAGGFCPQNPDVRAFEITASNPIRASVREDGFDFIRHKWLFEVDHWWVRVHLQYLTAFLR